MNNFYWYNVSKGLEEFFGNGKHILDASNRLSILAKDQIRILISYPKGQQIEFSFVTLIIQIDVPKSEQIPIIARPIPLDANKYPVVWDRGKAAISFQHSTYCVCFVFLQKVVDGVRNKHRLLFLPFCWYLMLFQF